ncbi:hypothetical protein AK812_SmicGene40123 [Symbiodinium microadriaticum]|uniref:Uncharacterized protein n=1 Tax=Symbiodinium microadriaticum TaxID=2951 RepID=A0A1Q9C9K2_SYMMI|nr:hypothetical protein AK812_SmicGene40123 [Symbiodinium microadriaticum]
MAVDTWVYAVAEVAIMNFNIPDSLQDRLTQLLAQKRALKPATTENTKALKVAKQKKRRLLQHAKKLSRDDLLIILAVKACIRDLGPQGATNNGRAGQVGTVSGAWANNGPAGQVISLEPEITDSESDSSSSSDPEMVVAEGTCDLRQVHVALSSSLDGISTYGKTVADREKLGVFKPADSIKEVLGTKFHREVLQKRNLLGARKPW